MRDSWIDKEEFEELLGSFSTPKKGLRRKSRPSLRKDRPVNRTGKVDSSPRVADVSPEPVIDSAAEGVLPVPIDVDTSMEPCLYELGSIFELEEDEAEEEPYECEKEKKWAEPLELACPDIPIVETPGPEGEFPAVDDGPGGNFDLFPELPFFEPGEFDGTSIPFDPAPEPAGLIEIVGNVVI